MYVWVPLHAHVLHQVDTKLLIIYLLFPSLPHQLRWLSTPHPTLLFSIHMSISNVGLSCPSLKHMLEPQRTLKMMLLSLEWATLTLWWLGFGHLCSPLFYYWGFWKNIMQQSVWIRRQRCGIHACNSVATCWMKAWWGAPPIQPSAQLCTFIMAAHSAADARGRLQLNFPS